MYDITVIEHVLDMEEEDEVPETAKGKKHHILCCYTCTALKFTLL